MTTVNAPTIQMTVRNNENILYALSSDSLVCDAGLCYGLAVESVLSVDKYPDSMLCEQLWRNRIQELAMCGDKDDRVGTIEYRLERLFRREA